MFNISFRIKLFIIFVVFSVSIIFFSIYNFTHVLHSQNEASSSDLIKKVSINKEKFISSFLSRFDTLIYAIYNDQSFQSYIKKNTQKKNIEELFKTLLKAEKSILQIRYIDNNGFEKVRVESKNGDVKVLEESKLQNKSKRYYFTEITKQVPGQIWHSKMDLNIENGKIEKPDNPVIRLGINAYYGIIVVNVSLKDIVSVFNDNFMETYLVDQEGNILIDSNNKYSWSKYKKININLKTFLELEDLSFLQKNIYTSKRFRSIKISATNNDGAVLIVHYPKDYLEAEENYIITVSIRIFIGSIIFSLLLAYFLSRPIININEETEELNEVLEKDIEKRTRSLENSMAIIDKNVIRSITDSQGNITDVSDAFCQISGYTKAELIGRSHSIVRHSDMKDEVFHDLWETIKKGKVWSGEIKNKTKDGGYYWVNALITPNLDEEGNIISYTSIRQNITDKKELQIQNEKKKAIITFASSGIGTMDMNGNFLSVNGAYTKLFGYSTEEMLTKSCIELSHPDYVDMTKKSIKIAKEVGTIAQLEKVCKHKDGHDVYVEISLDLLPDKNSFVVVVNSLEDKKRLEGLNRLLEYRIKEEVDKNTEQLKLIQAEQLKSVKLTSIGSLAAGITHEINTPLTYIKGNFEMMKFDIEDLPNSETKDRMIEDSAKISDGINRIANIVEAMREVSQTSSEVKELVNIYSTLITSLTLGFNRSKQISQIFINDEIFEVGMDKNKHLFNVKAQKQRIEQVWIVIINNALDELIKLDEYENRYLKIYVEEKDEKVIVKFKDNAGGIKEDILDNIFEPFVSSKQAGGVGVGLNIAQKIIQEQNGKIVAYNEDEGAVFEIQLDSDKG